MHGQSARSHPAAATVMGMPQETEPVYWTRERVLALPEDGQRYELVHGELLVSPAPRKRHQEVVLGFLLELNRYLERHPVGQILMSPADIGGDDQTLLQPDLFVLDPVAARSADWSAVQQLLLVVEVLSPSTARHDRFSKRRRYQEAGVPVYWIVDPNEELVEVWNPSDAVPRSRARAAAVASRRRQRRFELQLRELLQTGK